MNKFLIVLLVLTFNLGFSQDEENLVLWKMEIKSSGHEDMKEVHISAKVKKGWQLYSNDFNPNLGPLVTEFKYVVTSDYQLMRGTIPQGSKRKYDEIWGGEYSYFENEALFIQTIKTTAENPNVECQISYQVCNAVDGKCIPFEYVLIPTVSGEGSN